MRFIYVFSKEHWDALTETCFVHCEFSRGWFFFKSDGLGWHVYRLDVGVRRLTMEKDYIEKTVDQFIKDQEIISSLDMQ